MECDKNEKAEKKLKKEKKHKKHKKNKKHKHSKRSGCSSSDSEPVEWEEKNADALNRKSNDQTCSPKVVSQTESHEFDNLMKNIISGRQKTVKETREEKTGHHTKELNPYWKDGGQGLPSDEKKREKLASAVGGDGGLSWWTRALQRCKETAAEEGRSLDDVASDKYGSLDALMNRIKEAELYVASSGQSFASHKSSTTTWKNSMFKKPSYDNDSYYQNYSKDRCSDLPQKVSHKQEEHQQEQKKYATARKSDMIRESEFSVSRRHLNDSSKEMSSSSKHFPQTNHNQVLSAEEKNKLSARMLRAQLTGETVELESSSLANKEKRNMKRSSSDEDGELLTLTNSKGESRPFPERKHPLEASGSRRKKQKVETHKDGERTKYFHDDDEHSLRSLVENEKLTSAYDDFAVFNKMFGKTTQPLGDDGCVDDEVIRKEATKQSASLMESKQKQLAIIEQKKMSSKIDNCSYCLQNIQKHLIISIGCKVLLCLPQHKSMAPGHCLIIPMQHVIQSTVCDEDVLEEIKAFKRSLMKMFEKSDEDCVFMETCKNLKYYPHLVIECIPLPRDVGDMAPMYFKKAISESENEWNQNKKLVTIKKSIKHSIPPGFPYFHVAFGMDEGYGHVIEDEQSFPFYFGREVVGGMLDLDPTLWRKPRTDEFEEQRKKVLKFTNIWKEFDHTAFKN